MTSILLIILAVAVVVEGMVLLFIVRQLGLMTLRLPSDAIEEEAAVRVGDVISNLSVETLGESEKTNFVFASLSCPLCQPILTRLHELPLEQIKSIRLMLLERDLDSSWIKEKLTKYKLNGIQIMNGYPWIKIFAIKRTPFWVAVDRAGKVLQKEFLKDALQMIN